MWMNQWYDKSQFEATEAYFCEWAVHSVHKTIQWERRSVIVSQVLLLLRKLWYAISTQVWALAQEFGLLVIIVSMLSLFCVFRLFCLFVTLELASIKCQNSEHYWTLLNTTALILDVHCMYTNH